MNTDLETDVRAFVAEFTGRKLERVQTGTTLFGDLGVDGDDGVELFEAFAERFDVDLGDIDLARHFGPEGFIPWCLVTWLVMAFRKGTPEEKAELVPIYVRDLVLAAQRKRWGSP